MITMEGRAIGLSRDLLICPGETIADVLESRNMAQAELAKRAGVSPQHIGKVIRGEKSISVSLARGLEYALQVDSSFWLKLQTQHDQELYEIQQQENISDDEFSVLKHLKSIIDYLKEGKIYQGASDKTSLVLYLRKLLKISNLTAIPTLAKSGAYRGRTEVSIDPYVMYAWQVLCEERLTDNLSSRPLNLVKLREMLPVIKELMFLDPNEMRAGLQEVFSQCGITFDIVKHFKGAPVQGFIKRLATGNLLLCVTIRQCYADIFWFTLFHEIAHILNGDVDQQFVDYDFSQNETEKIANEFAGEILLSSKAYARFIEAQDYSLPAIKQFSKLNRVQPYIVIGRLQKEKRLLFSSYSNMKIRYKWC